MLSSKNAHGITLAAALLQPISRKEDISSYHIKITKWEPAAREFNIKYRMSHAVIYSLIRLYLFVSYILLTGLNVFWMIIILLGPGNYVTKC